MSRDTVMARGRTRAEESFVDTCTITRQSGETTDPNTGVVTPTILTLYTGVCRIQQRTVAPSPTDAGEAYTLLLSMEVQLPMSVTGLRVGDLITITASRHDPDLVNRAFLVRGLAHESHATARRVQVTERTS